MSLNEAMPYAEIAISKKENSSIVRWTGYGSTVAVKSQRSFAGWQERADLSPASVPATSPTH